MWLKRNRVVCLVFTSSWTFQWANNGRMDETVAGCCRENSTWRDLASKLYWQPFDQRNPACWSSGNAFVSGAGGSRFKSWAVQVGHRVANGSSLGRTKFFGDFLQFLKNSPKSCGSTTNSVYYQNFLIKCLFYASSKYVSMAMGQKSKKMAIASQPLC